MRKLLPTLLEAAFAGLAVVGVAMIFLPAGLILAGILGVFAVERGAQ